MDEGLPGADEPWQWLRRIYGDGVHESLLLLKRHLELGQGFAFIPVFVPEVHAAQLARDGLAKCLEASGHALWDMSIGTPGQLTELPLRLQTQVPPPRCGALWVGPVVSMEGTDTASWRSQWKEAVRRLNERRDVFRARLRFPLIIAGPPWLKPIWQQEAPDFWSVRDLVVEASPGEASAIGLGNALPPLATGSEAMLAGIWKQTSSTAEGYWISDPTRAVHQAHRLRSSSTTVPQAVELLVQAAYWSLAHGEPGEGLRLSSMAEEWSRPRSETEDAHPERIQARVAALRCMAAAMNIHGKSGDALPRLREAASLAAGLAEREPGRFTGLAADVLLDLARDVGTAGGLLEAIGILRASMSLRERVASGDPSARSASAILLTFLLDAANDLHGAEKASRAALDFLSDATARKQAPAGHLAMALHQRGSVLAKTGRPEEAVEVLAEAVKVIKAVEDEDFEAGMPRLQALSLVLRAHTLFGMGRIEEAVQTQAAAVAVAREVASWEPSRRGDELAYQLVVLGAMLGKVGRLQEARERCMEALSLVDSNPADRSLGDHFQPAHFLGILADIERRLGLQGAALARLRAALQCLRRAGRREDADRLIMESMAKHYLLLLSQLGREPDFQGPEAFLKPESAPKNHA